MFSSGPTWQKIVQTRPGYLAVSFTYLLPTLLLVALVEGYGLVHWGKSQARFDVVKIFDLHDAITFEVCRALVMIAVVFLSALVILRISQTFHLRNNYLQTFTLAAYSLGPLFFLTLLNVLPIMNPWVTWALGITLTVYALYQGVPRMLDPDPTHAFGLYLSSACVLFLLTGLLSLVSGLYLLGYSDFQHSWLARHLSHLFSPAVSP